MGTRSYIAIHCKTNQGPVVKYVYCHNDGYVYSLGKTLLTNYRTRSKVGQLIAGGDLFSVGQEVHPDPSMPHSFENDQKGVSVYFIRDRGDPAFGAYQRATSSADSIQDLADEVKEDVHIEYLYVYEVDETGRSGNSEGEWFALTNEDGVAGGDVYESTSLRFTPLVSVKDFQEV